MADKGTVLIIDDVEINRLILEEIIKDMGCQPVLAESGEQALSMIRESLPQLVLTDISMPGMSGYDLCRILKKDAKTRSIPVIFISAHDNTKDIVEGFSLGGEDYITKPFVSEIVQARVGVHLRLTEASRELRETNRRFQVSINEQLKQMEQEKKNILYALANIAAQNASYEEGHIDRIRKNCRILAQAMQISPVFEAEISDTFVDTVGLSAPLCDIGNIGIPIEILQKKEGMTEEETAVLQNHTSLGAKFLSDLCVSNDYNDFIKTSIEVAHYHHENWDGSGYPDALRGDEIPLAAQIVSVVERYCMLTDEHTSGTTNRTAVGTTNRAAVGREEALEIMDREAGIKFNPDIYKIFHKISRQLC